MNLSHDDDAVPQRRPSPRPAEPPVPAGSSPVRTIPAPPVPAVAPTAPTARRPAAVSSPLCGMVVDATGARPATVAIPISAGLAAVGALLAARSDAARSDAARSAVPDPTG